MITGYENKIRIKLNRPLRGMRVGAEKKILVDKDGTPLDRYWRDRMKDMKTDHCIEVLRGEENAN